MDLSLLRQNDAVILEVADTGPGIPASEIDRISNRSFVEVAREVMEPASAFRLCVV